MTAGGEFAFTAGIEDLGSRLDQVIAARLDGCSRSLIGNLIRKGAVYVNEDAKKPAYSVKPGDRIAGHIPSPEPISLQAEPIDIDILFEDRDIIIINKPAGMVVHPAPGHMSGTMVNALLYHCPDIEGTGGQARPGIVHRLDKDTSGAIVVAKNQNAHIKLSAQFEARSVHKEYLSVVYGALKADTGKSDLPIGRHPTERTKMAVVKGFRGRCAETHWTVLERFEGLSLLSLILKTGRTHQLRVHCTAMHHPIVGDRVYGSSKVFRNFHKQPVLLTLLKSMQRQMLHAFQVAFEAPLPADMASLLSALRGESRVRAEFS